MEPKETIKDKIRQAKLQLGDDYGDIEMMEEAIFKAGISEVVEFVEQQRVAGLTLIEGIGVGIPISETKWQAKLKDWGL